MTLSCQSLCLGCLLTFFVPNVLFLLSHRLGLIRHHLMFHGYGILKRNQFSFHQNYLRYLEYFQEENGLLGFHFVFSNLNFGLEMLCLRKCFLVTETFQYWVNIFRNECNECNIYTMFPLYRIAFWSVPQTIHHILQSSANRNVGSIRHISSFHCSDSIRWYRLFITSTY